MCFARLALGHTSSGSLLGREETPQDRGTEVITFTLGLPMEESHILCFEAIALFL